MNALNPPKLSWLHRLGLALTSGLAIVAGFAIASVLLTVLLLAALLIGGWLWWQYRRMTQKLRTASSDFIEAEYTVESDPVDPADPADPAARRRLTATAEPDPPAPRS